nr:MAG TPA: hypothetical protein [Caudoviricetes sp.]
MQGSRASLGRCADAFAAVRGVDKDENILVLNILHHGSSLVSRGLLEGKNKGCTIHRDGNSQIIIALDGNIEHAARAFHGGCSSSSSRLIGLLHDIAAGSQRAHTGGQHSAIRDCITGLVGYAAQRKNFPADIAHVGTSVTRTWTDSRQGRQRSCAYQ